MVTVIFDTGQKYTGNTGNLWQYDYGQVLRIQGLMLPAAVEVHFSLQDTGGEAITRVGVTKDNVTDVTIPDSMLENACASENYYIYVFVYLTDETSGETEYKIKLRIKSRPKPEAFKTTEDTGLFREAIAAVQEASTEAREAKRQAEGYAHGREDLPEREEDNAAYYAARAKDALMQVSGEVEDAKKDIDRYCRDKESKLKGDTGNVYFTSFRVVGGRLKMYADPAAIKVAFLRHGSRLAYKVQIGG